MKLSDHEFAIGGPYGPQRRGYTSGPQKEISDHQRWNLVRCRTSGGLSRNVLFRNGKAVSAGVIRGHDGYALLYPHRREKARRWRLKVKSIVDKHRVALAYIAAVTTISVFLQLRQWVHNG